MCGLELEAQTCFVNNKRRGGGPQPRSGQQQREHGGGLVHQAVRGGVLRQLQQHQLLALRPRRGRLQLWQVLCCRLTFEDIESEQTIVIGLPELSQPWPRLQLLSPAESRQTASVLTQPRG